MFLKRHVRTRLDFLKPSISETVRRRQYQQKDEHDRQAAERQFDVDDPVYLRNTAGECPKWIAGVVTYQTGPVSYRVQGETTDQVYRHHGVQLRPRYPPDILDPGPEGVTKSAEQESDFGEPPEPLVPETVLLRRSGHTTQRPSRYRD